MLRQLVASVGTDWRVRTCDIENITKALRRKRNRRDTSQGTRIQLRERISQVEILQELELYQAIIQDLLSACHRKDIQIRELKIRDDVGRIRRESSHDIILREIISDDPNNAPRNRIRYSTPDAYNSMHVRTKLEAAALRLRTVYGGLY